MAALPTCRKKLKSIIPLTSLCMNCGALDVSVFFNHCKHCLHNQNEHEVNMLGLLLTEYFTPIDELNAMGNMIREINKHCDDPEVKELALLQHRHNVDYKTGLSGDNKAKAEDVLSQCTIPPPETVPPEVSQSTSPVMEIDKINRNKYLLSIFESTEIEMCSETPISMEISMKFRKIDGNEDSDDSEKWEYTITVKNNSKDKKTFLAKLTFFDSDNLKPEPMVPGSISLHHPACLMCSTSTTIFIRIIEAHQEKKESTIFYLNCKYINQIAFSKLIVEIWPGWLLWNQEQNT